MGDVRDWDLLVVTDLHRLNWYCQAIGVGLLVLPLQCAREVLKPGGNLEQLGLGSVKISERDARNLMIWRCITTFFGLLLFAGETFTFFKNGNKIWFTGTGTGECFYTPREEWEAKFSGQEVRGQTKFDACVASEQRTVAERLDRRFKWVLLPVLTNLLLPVLIMGFFYTLRIGALLARDATSQVIASALACDPHDKNSWDSNIAGPALQLEKTFRCLSNGWGRGLFGIGSLLWLMALANFCKAIDHVTYLRVGEGCYDDETGEHQPYCHRNFALIQMCMYLSLPLLLTLDIASTSNRCDHLMDVLNSVRMANGEECHIRTSWLIESLRSLHRDQGLGFTISGVVVDKVALRNLALAIGGSLTTIITVLLSLTEEPPPNMATSICPVSDQQRRIVQELFATDSNSNCTYANVTVGGILNDGGH